MEYSTSVSFKAIRLSLEAHPGDSLAVLSARLQMERHAVERIVRSQAGCTFRTFQSLCRLQAAKKYLALPNCSIKEIAVMLGYRSPRAFSRFFREHAAQSPSEYRSNGPAQPPLKAEAKAAASGL